MTDGYRALTLSAALIDVSKRARIRATGEDRARLLHALTTNHIQQLLPDHGCYAFFLNANGRILADATILVFPDHILIESEPELREPLFQHLDHYIIADDVSLHDDTETTFAFGVEGPHAEAELKRHSIPTPANAYEHLDWNGITVAHLSSTGEPGFRLYGPLDRRQPVADLLYLPEPAPHDIETVRIEHGRPRYGVDFSAANIAAETGLTSALHFQKGCYLGQEIVERVRSRGHINKRMVRLELNGHDVLPEKARITVEGKETGEISSAAFSPRIGKTAALAMQRLPFDQTGTAIQAGGVEGWVVGAVTG